MTKDDKCRNFHPSTSKVSLKCSCSWRKSWSTPIWEREDGDQSWWGQDPCPCPCPCPCPTRLPWTQPPFSLESKGRIPGRSSDPILKSECVLREWHYSQGGGETIASKTKVKTIGTFLIFPSFCDRSNWFNWSTAQSVQNSIWNG